MSRDSEIRELKEKLDQADARRRALEEERKQKVEEHLQKVQQVREADHSQYVIALHLWTTEHCSLSVVDLTNTRLTILCLCLVRYEQHKAELDQKMKAAEQRRIQLEAALKEKIHAKQALADQVRQRKVFLYFIIIII